MPQPESTPGYTQPRRIHGHPLRIVLASRAPFFGGAEQAAYQLAKALVAAGHRVKIVLGAGGVTEHRMLEAGLDVQIIPLPNTGKLRALKYRMSRKALRRLIRRFDPHIVHANDLPTHQIVSDAARGLGIPRLCHHRFAYTPQAVCWFNKYGAERHVFVSRAFMEQMCGQCTQLATAPRDVLYDGIELGKLPTEADRHNCRKALRLPTDHTLFTYTGQIILRKGVADLIRAWSLLSKSHRGCASLVIVGEDLGGEGAYRLEMEQLARQLGVDALFTGFREDVDRWVTASDVTVMPSHADPLGMSVMEAMALGRATIGSRVGGIPEMIVHEKSGLLTPPGSPEDLAAAITRMIDQPAMRMQMGKQARLRCEQQFSLDAHLQQALLQYDQLLKYQITRQSA